MDKLTNTFEYTFIDLPELVDGSEDLEDSLLVTPKQPAPAQNFANASTHIPQQHQQQQHLQKQQAQPSVSQLRDQQYLFMPYWQQLQQGAQVKKPPAPSLGPLGQAMAASMQAGPTADQQQHQQQQQAAFSTAAQQPSAVPGLSSGTQQQAAQPSWAAAQPRPHGAWSQQGRGDADMDEG